MSNNIEENIDALAAAKSYDIPGKWIFTPVLPLIVDDLNTNSYTTPPHVWIVAAFHGANHYSFYGINPDPNMTAEATRIQFVTDVATTFWPLFYPEHVFKGSIAVPQLSEEESLVLQAKMLIGGKQ